LSWHQIPFVRLLIPLLAGILSCSLYSDYRVNLVLLTIFGISALFLLYWAVSKKLSYVFVISGAFVLGLNLYSLGYLLTFFGDSRNSEKHFQQYISQENNLIAKIVGEPQLKSKTVSAVVSVASIEDSSGNFHECIGKVSISFELDSLSAKLKYGDMLLLSAEIKNISGPENPNAFNPSSYYALSNIYHQAYVKSNRSKLIAHNKSNYAYSLLISWRAYLSDIFSNNFKNYPNEKAVASALVLGVRSDFSTELKNAYADTGATHVLSVSGLHVGLVAGLLGWILRRIKKKKTDKFSPREIAILILFIWFYVLLTGASASVLRSGLMFSFVLLAGLVRRKMSIYNSLAASAFFLLCLDPKYLFDIGFQLSYLALFGIVFFHPYIYKLFYFKNKATNWAWNLTAVAIAAQIATLPVGLYYFHQFPSYFWLSGLAVIPLSTFALYSGIVLLIVDWIPYLGDIVALLCYFSLALMNACIFAIQRLPLSVIDGFWLGIGEMLLFYLIIFMVSAAFIYKSLKIGYLSFLLVFVLFCGQFWNLLQSSAQEKLFVYKINKSTLIEFGDGHSSYLISDSTLAKNKIDFFTENNRTANKLMFGKSYKLGDSINVANLFIEKNRIGKFKEFSFAIPNNTSLELTRNREAPLKIDFLILSANPTIKNLEQLESLFDYRYLVFDASSSRYKIQQWIRQCKELSIPYVNCSEKGIDLLSFSQKSAN